MSCGLKEFGGQLIERKQNHQLYYPLDPISDRMALWDDQACNK